MSTNYHQSFLPFILWNTALCQSYFISKEDMGDKDFAKYFSYSLKILLKLQLKISNDHVRLHISFEMITWILEIFLLCFFLLLP